MQLKSAEQTQKDDQSPVTIADYGAHYHPPTRIQTITISISTRFLVRVPLPQCTKETKCNM